MTVLGREEKSRVGGRVNLFTIAGGQETKSYIGKSRNSDRAYNFFKVMQENISEAS